MTRRSFFLALAATAVFWGAGAIEARATSVPLSSLLGTTVDINGLDFTFLNYTSNLTPAADVTVTYPAPGDPTLPGFLLTGVFGAGPGTINDSDLVYTVAAAPGSGLLIDDAELAGNPASTGDSSLASVTELLRNGSSGLSPPIVPTSGMNPLYISSTTTPGPVFMTFTPTAGPIYVSKDIESIGGTFGASLSNITQAFSVTGGSVPEPSSMALLGIGMASFMAFRRFIRRAPQA
jgi:hypothetical protein